jgi:hypothetical protein
MTSNVPGVNMRPSVISKSWRSPGAAAELTPRSGTYASVPVDFIGTSTMT